MRLYVFRLGGQASLISPGPIENSTVLVVAENSEKAWKLLSNRLKFGSHPVKNEFHLMRSFKLSDNQVISADSLWSMKEIK